MVRFDPKGPWKLLCYFTRDCMRTLRITVWAKADILGPDETRNEMKRVKCVRELREAWRTTQERSGWEVGSWRLPERGWWFPWWVQRVPWRWVKVSGVSGLEPEYERWSWSQWGRWALEQCSPSPMGSSNMTTTTHTSHFDLYCISIYIYISLYYNTAACSKTSLRKLTLYNWIKVSTCNNIYIMILGNIKKISNLLKCPHAGSD